MAEQDYTAAVADIRKINLPDFYWSWLLKIAAFGHLGEQEAAADSLVRLQNLMPGISAQYELEKWNTEAGDLENIMQGLVKAGYNEPWVFWNCYYSIDVVMKVIPYRRMSDTKW